MYKVDITFFNDLNHVCSLSFEAIEEPYIDSVNNIFSIITKERILNIPLNHILRYTITTMYKFKT